MKTNYVAILAILLLAAIRSEAAEASPEKSSRSIRALTVECPMTLTVGVQNPPAGWSPFIAPGAAIQKFKGANLSKEGTDNLIGCFYDNNKDGFPPYALSRKVPGNYRCTIAPSASGFPSRLINCRPFIITKKS